MITKPKKYTLKFVTKEIQDILKEVKADPTVIWIGEVLEKRDYDRHVLAVWVKDYPKISSTYNKIKSILEGRIAKRATTGDYNAKFCEFNLINNYGWVSEKNINLGGQKDNPVNVSATIDVKSLPDAILRALEAVNPNGCTNEPVKK